jgi:hypothetical protein
VRVLPGGLWPSPFLGDDQAILPRRRRCVRVSIQPTEGSSPQRATGSHICPAGA